MKRGDYASAMDCFESALVLRQEWLGRDHEKCSDTLHNMGLVHKNRREYTDAIVLYEQALRIRRMQLGQHELKVADTLYNVAIVHANTSQYAQALETYKLALRTYRATGMTNDHPSVVNTLQWIKWAQKKLRKSSSPSRRNLLHYQEVGEC
uniref:Kinesin light chain n=1 Tax=Cyclophora tenuis TaxID=216820 RepID=A0A7S1DD32_CYCTE|mmetsp:Transcript_977/g.1777  ORF Transcript_977/g.1777 Transcript_977/m.1777 type:complete len:151 (+) Transcript_977:3-455(+)